MPIWIMLLITLLGWLLQWLLTRAEQVAKGAALNEKERRKVNHILWQMRQCEAAGARCGAWAEEEK